MEFADPTSQIREIVKTIQWTLKWKKERMDRPSKWNEFTCWWASRSPKDIPPSLIGDNETRGHSPWRPLYRTVSCSSTFSFVNEKKKERKDGKTRKWFLVLFDSFSSLVFVLTLRIAIFVPGTQYQAQLVFFFLFLYLFFSFAHLNAARSQLLFFVGIDKETLPDNSSQELIIWNF